MKHLTERDWGAVIKDFEGSSPFNYAILDDFLSPETLAALRPELIKSENWEGRDIPRENKGAKWVARQVFNDRPGSPLICAVSQELQDALPGLLGGKVLMNHWAISCNRNEGIFPHCDGGRVSLNLWLTPGQFNEDLNSGGLILFDVKRAATMSPDEYASQRGGCVQYVNERTRGRLARIPYGYNRAVLFDAWTFHATDAVRFAGNALAAARLNLTFSFEEPPPS
ncbi:MAG: hypothetical protein M3416_01545 [Acidobacteriota bacterium]|nr:hypothetical protein [Acidobacteriota bacterium]